jgi:DNA modification methylase
LILEGDCVEVMRGMEAESIDALVTDPPAGIKFMGKSWDSDRGSRNAWIAWLTEVMEEAYRVMKPGAHGLVWALPRTSHWTGMALEDAGFEVRDRLHHIFGSGFPKSANIGKHLDKMAGAEREVVGVNEDYLRRKPNGMKTAGATAYGYSQTQQETDASITAPATEAAKRWDGWGTALKPAVEDWWLIRKPLSESSVARNVLEWGTGGINVDGSRVATNGETPTGSGDMRGRATYAQDDYTQNHMTNGGNTTPPAGRFPANLLLSHDPACNGACVEGCPVRVMDEQSGTLKSGANPKRRGADTERTAYGDFSGQQEAHAPRGVNEGGASRFFQRFDAEPGFQYVAKASRRERNAGLEGMPESVPGFHANGQAGTRLGNQNERANGQTKPEIAPRANGHPTVKPIALMRYLTRLICPPNGVVLDPFAGSGSTGCAAVLEGFDFVGIEREAEYAEIARRRIAHWQAEAAELPELATLF